VVHATICSIDPGRRASVACSDVRGGNPLRRVAYLESSTAPGMRIEYIQYTADGLAGWQQRVEAARTWNGKDPIQVYDLGG
jgi:hypothetical protein